MGGGRTGKGCCLFDPVLFVDDQTCALTCTTLCSTVDDDDLDDEGAAEGIQRPRDIALRATLELASGVAMCSVFSDPFVDALSHLSAASHVPPFFVGCDTCTHRAVWHS